jgi:hypothetical protein
MPATKYTKSISVDFPNGKFDGSRLDQEIRDSAIITALDRIDGGITAPDNCDIWFKDALSAGDQTVLDGIVAVHSGEPLQALVAADMYFEGQPAPHTGEDVLRVSVEPTEALSSKKLTSHNFADRRTWYQESTKHLAMALVDSGDGLTFNGTNAPWIDNYHGRYADEDILLTKDGDLPRMVVYIDGVPATEQDPHLEAGGDYTVDYTNGTVTFLASQAGKTITVDVWSAGSSLWKVEPAPGKMLKLLGAETQLSVGTSLRDTVHFEIWAYNPADLPNKMMVQNKVYKTMSDYEDDANSTNPVVKKTSHPSPKWRDLDDDLQVFPWDYASVSALLSSQGAEVRIRLEHDTPFDSSTPRGRATATLFFLSSDE